MSYKSVIITQKGGPEVLKIVQKEFRTLEKDEVLIKIQACAVGGTDISMRYYIYPFSPKFPFVPGYEIVGIVQEVGLAVHEIKVGERVAALTVHGGYSEFIYLKSDHLVKVPYSVDSAEAAVIILNYTSAFQMLKKVARVKEGDKILVTGGSGGVGSAFLDLGKLEKLKLYATSSISKHGLLKQYDARLIDYKSEDLAEVINQAEPGGLDFVFDGIGGSYIKQSFILLRSGGMLVEYGFPFKSFAYFLKYLFTMLTAFAFGVKSRGYGISVNYKRNKQEVKADISTLLSLLEKGKIHPQVYKRIPILQAAEANRILESGEVTGNIVLVEL